MIDTRLHTLLTLMEAGSYTKAARVLSLTQPAVSHHIRQLEQEYGAPVFYRSTKQLKLTPEGGILVKYARRMQALEQCDSKPGGLSQRPFSIHRGDYAYR